MKESFLVEYDLPDILYPIPLSKMEEFVESGNIEFDKLLCFLQQYSHSCKEWQDLETAINKLTVLLAPKNENPLIDASGDEWRISCGVIDLGQEIVTIQRGGHLIASIRPMDNGQLIFCTYRPLDAKSAEYLIGLSRIPDPKHGVCMRENNWEYALDCSAGMGNMYASERGEPYLSYWQFGLGVSRNKTIIETWHNQRSLKPVKPIYSIVQLGIYYENSAEDM